jgi:hypothetical protein
MTTDDDIYRAIKERMREPEFIAEVLKCAALIEGDMDACLCLYFAASGKHFDFVDHICGRLRYEAKVQLIENLPVRKNLKSRALALDGLRRIQKVRNLVAHPAFIPGSKIRALQKDALIQQMILQFPARFSGVFRDARRGLYYLSRSKEWRPNTESSKPRHDDFFLERWRKEIYA